MQPGLSAQNPRSMGSMSDIAMLQQQQPPFRVLLAMLHVTGDV
jgi:hypothetical protein